MSYRTQLKQNLQKERMELDRKREEEERKKQRELAQIQMSSNVDVPSSGASQGPAVSIDVPSNVLEVSLPLVLRVWFDPLTLYRP